SCMRRLSIRLLASGITASTLSLLPGLVFAAPPTLPDAEFEDEAPPADDASGDEMLTADGQPMPTDTQPAGPGEDVIDDGTGAEAGGEFDAGFEADSDSALESTFDSDTEAAGTDEADVSMG